MDERQQKIDDTRKVLDWLEAHPDVPLPRDLDQGNLSILSLDSKEEALFLAREFGSCEKAWNDESLRIIKYFGSMKLSALFFREYICERTVIGTEEVPENVTPAHRREIVDWKCDPLLA